MLITTVSFTFLLSSGDSESFFEFIFYLFYSHSKKSEIQGDRDFFDRVSEFKS